MITIKIISLLLFPTLIAMINIKIATIIATTLMKILLILNIIDNDENNIIIIASYFYCSLIFRNINSDNKTRTIMKMIILNIISNIF